MSVRDVANDRDDFLHDITAGAAGGISQQIFDRSADLCFGVVFVGEIPIELIGRGTLRKCVCRDGAELS